MRKVKTRSFDMGHYLNDEEDVTAYLQAAVEDGDPALLAAALGDIAKARGMTQLAKDTGMSRESLYKSLLGERAPNSDTLFKVMRALGLNTSHGVPGHPGLVLGCWWCDPCDMLLVSSQVPLNRSKPEAIGTHPKDSGRAPLRAETPIHHA